MVKPSVFRKIEIDPVAAQNRLTEGRREAARIIGAMKEKGVVVELFGSMRKGTSHPNSDIDLLVIDCGPLDPAFVIYEIGLLSRDIPVDVMLLKYVPQRSLACVMESLHGAMDREVINSAIEASGLTSVFMLKKSMWPFHRTPRKIWFIRCNASGSTRADGQTRRR